ncbi:MAG: hypothetical protein JO261_11415 [Alphaproteobacteria bacterium]|nr:hypothetical protein [Alphaproteobacteria bacterium]MBV9694297.1 hypothetical protein [Alphaproteobacteria bacterium]
MRRSLPAIRIVDPDSYAHDGAPIVLDRTHPLHGEPLVPLDDLGIAYACHHARSDGGNWPYHRAIAGAHEDMWLRRSAAERLARVNARLEEFGAELLVLDAYRPLACQIGLWNYYVEDEARRALPEAEEQAREAYALERVFDPRIFSRDDPLTWPAHVCGGSVDVTMRDRASGNTLDMGVRFEDIGPSAAADHFERGLAAGTIGHDDPRLLIRRLMHWAMMQEGFLNDPFAVWHFDWGNHIHARIHEKVWGGEPRAPWYGYIDPPAAWTSTPIASRASA